jgi:hypothetical protein
MIMVEEKTPQKQMGQRSTTEKVDYDIMLVNVRSRTR